MSYLIHPWNPFGDNPECVVKDESISALGEDRDLLVPRYGPFFEKGFVLKDAQTGVKLEPGKDFAFAYPFKEFIQHYNRTVFGGITLLASGLGRQLIITEYKTIGEPFTLSDQDFVSLTANIIHSDRIADWSQVVNLPMEGFPADPHEHEPDLTYNYKLLIDRLEEQNRAMRDEFNNPTVASELAEHIALAMHLAHPDASAEDFNLGNVANYRPATDADLSGNSDQLYMTLAKVRKLFPMLLEEMGIEVDHTPEPSGDVDKMDQAITMREAMELFLAKGGDLSEIAANGAIARRNARENLGLGDVVDARIKQETGQSTTDLMSQKAITDELNKRVPMTRRVNGKALSSDITISAADLGVYTKAEVDTRLNTKFDKSSVSQATGSSTTAVMSQKAVTDQLGTKVPTSRKVNGKALSSDITISAADTGAYTKAQVDSLINGRVPTGRRINGKPLTSDISLSSNDVGAYTKAEVNSRLDAKFDKNRLTGSTGSSTAYVMTQKAVTDNLNTKVPTSRRVNGHQLTGDITISASNVGAYTKAEVDSRLNNKFDKSSVSQGSGSSTTAVMSQKAVTNYLNGKVPTSRKVNGKPLTSDVTISKADLGLSVVENKKWTRIKTGSISLGLANGWLVYRGEVNTGVTVAGRRFNTEDFRIVLLTAGSVNSGSPNTMWWGGRGDLFLKQHWSKGNQLWFKVYGSGTGIQSGSFTGWELWQWK